jgi:hypothetical protein
LLPVFYTLRQLGASAKKNFSLRLQFSLALSALQGESILQTKWKCGSKRRVEMRRVPCFSVAFLIAMLSVFISQPVWAAPLQYYGGPFLETFEIYPLYYGPWTEWELTAQQNYLVNLAAYMSGKNAPASEQPVMKQYGVNQVTVAPAATASPGATARVLSRSDLLGIIHANQTSGKLPAFGPGRLLVIFPSHGFSVNGCNGCGGYHSSESNSAFWTVIPEDQGQVVIAHEIFEASADPADDNSQGWDEAVDACDSAPAVELSFGTIAPAVDNTNGGACTTTGYTSLGEYQLYGSTYADYLTRYNELHPQGWRLYSLQSYVLSNGGVRYTAVWRPSGNTGEKVAYGVTYAQFLNQYNTIYPEGWRLSNFQAYVLTTGEVRYNAVFRPGSTGERQAYGATYAQFQSQYDTLYPQGWRLYILQSYVVSGGQVLYNAVWRPGNTGETQVYGWTYSDFLNKYNELFPQGWRLYLLDSYVLSDGTVRYNAVWRPSTHAETQVYGWTYADYRTQYDTFWTEGWRLYILNAYVLPGDNVRYDAIWREGTIDRPL